MSKNITKIMILVVNKCPLTMMMNSYQTIVINYYQAFINRFVRNNKYKTIKTLIKEQHIKKKKG